MMATLRLHRHHMNPGELWMALKPAPKDRVCLWRATNVVERRSDATRITQGNDIRRMRQELQTHNTKGLG